MFDEGDSRVHFTLLMNPSAGEIRRLPGIKLHTPEAATVAALEKNIRHIETIKNIIIFFTLTRNNNLSL